MASIDKLSFEPGDMVAVHVDSFLSPAQLERLAAAWHTLFPDTIALVLPPGCDISMLDDEALARAGLARIGDGR